MSAYKDALNKITSGKSSSNTQKSSSSKSGSSSSAYKKALSKYYTPSNTNTKQQTILPLSERKLQAKETTNNSSSLNQSYVQKYYGMNSEQLLKEYDKLSNNPKSANEAAWVKNLAYRGLDRQQLLSTADALTKAGKADEAALVRNYANSYEKMSEQDYVHEVGNIQRQIDRAKQKGKKYVKEEGAPAATVFGDESYREYLEQDKINSLENQLNEKDSNGRSLLDNLYFKRGDNKYGNLESNDDYEVLSSTIDNNRAFGIQVGENFYGLGDNVYRYINKLGSYSDAANPSRHQADTGTEALLQKYDYMLPKEKDNYNYIYQTEGKDAANEYLEYLSYELNNRRINGVGFSNNDIQKYSGIKNTEGKLAADEYLKLLGDSMGYNLSADRLKGIKGENAENAGEGFWGAAGSSLKSVGTNLVSGLGMLDIAGQNLGRTLRGEYKPIDYNSAGMSANAATTAIRGTVTNNLRDKGEIKINEESHPIAYKLFNGKSWGDVYQLGMSMADSATIAALSPVIGGAGTFLLGGAAGTQGMLDALERGATDSQALSMGILNGAFETLFEYVSLDHLINGNTGNIVKDILLQGFVEGSEEVSTSLANNLADKFVMAEKSVRQENIREYMSNGLSYEEAYKQALYDSLVDIGWDFLGGALSGGIMGGVHTGISNAYQNVSQNIDVRNTFNGYNAAYDSALSNYLNRGMSLSDAQRNAGKDAKNRYNTEYSALTKRYISEGMSEAEAKAKAKSEAKANNTLNKDNASVKGLIDEVLEMDPNNKLANDLRNRLENGTIKRATGAEIKSLMEQSEQKMFDNDVESIKSAASQRLTEMGETSNVGPLAEIIAKQVAGETLTGVEENFLNSSKYGRTIAEQLNAENIQRNNGETADWVKGINTERLNAEEYGNILENAFNPKPFFNKNAVNFDKVSTAPKSLPGRADMSSIRSEATYKSTGNTTIDTLAAKVNRGEDLKRSDIDSVLDSPETISTLKSMGADLNFNGKSASQQRSMVKQAIQTVATNNVENRIVPNTGRASSSGNIIDQVKHAKQVNNFRGSLQSNADSNIRETRTLKESEVDDLKNHIVELGKGSFPLSAAQNSTYAKGLTSEEVKAAWEEGRRARDSETETKNAKIIQNSKTAGKKGRVIGVGVNVKDLDRAFSRMPTFSKYNWKQGTAYRYFTMVSEVTGWDIVLYKTSGETVTDKNGKQVYKEASGFINSGNYSDNTIYVAINAGLYGPQDVADISKYTLIDTFTHELVHQAQKWNGDEYTSFKEFVLNELAKESDVEALVNSVAEQQGLSQSAAADEVVAQGMVNILSQSTVMEQLAEEQPGVFQKILQALKEFVENLKKYFRDSGASTLEARLLQDNGQYLDEMVKKFDSLIKGAVHNYQNSEQAAQDSKMSESELQQRSQTELKKSLNEEVPEVVEALGTVGNIQTTEDGSIGTVESKDGSSIVCNARTYDDGGRSLLKKTLENNGFNDEEVNNALYFMDDIVQFLRDIAVNDKRLDKSLNQTITVTKKNGQFVAVLHTLTTNGDYPVNFDLSTICKKRVAYQRVLNNLLESGDFDKIAFNAEAIARINEILARDGFEVACAACFVEARRTQIQNWAESFADKWNAEVDKRNKNAGSFGFASGTVLLTEDEILKLHAELENGGEKNDKGNLNLGKGSVQTKIGKLLDKVPTLARHITAEDILLPKGLTELRKLDSNMISLLKQNYGAASPKITQEFEPYNGDAALLSFKYISDLNGESVHGAQAYVSQVVAEWNAKLPAKVPGKRGRLVKNKNFYKSTSPEVQREALRRYLYDIGGARSQSFSDFIIENVLDKLQLMADMAAQQLPMHEYTKEISSARIFGMTGLKENMSVIHHIDPSLPKCYAGLAKNGNKFVLVADDYANNQRTGGKSRIQSIGYKDAVALQLDPRYSSNCGTIAIGFSIRHILNMLDDNNIRMVIPYHKSGLPPIFAEMTNVAWATDFTDYQNTTVKLFYDLNGNIAAFNTKTMKVDTHYNYNQALRATGDARKAAQQYVDWCAEKHPVYITENKEQILVGYATFHPKFSNCEGFLYEDGSKGIYDFTTHENYYKLLEDFNVYDNLTNEPAPQGEIKMIFPGMDDATTLSSQQISDYRKALEKAGIFTQKEIDKYVAIAQKSYKDLIRDELSARKSFNDAQDEKFDSTMDDIRNVLTTEYPSTPEQRRIERAKKAKEEENNEDNYQNQSRTLAPTFYSKMENVIDAQMPNKMSIDQVIKFLTGKGVKAEEIRWSGIQPYLSQLQESGKKSVTKADLLEFAQANRLQVETVILDNNETRWDEYKVPGGTNYREYLYKLPGSDYTNGAMVSHWSTENKGVLVHARVQDFLDADGKKVLFIEEIQSDWHNAGAKNGYDSDYTEIENKYNRASEALTKEAGNLTLELTDTFAKANFDNPRGTANALLDYNPYSVGSMRFSEDLVANQVQKGIITREQGTAIKKYFNNVKTVTNLRSEYRTAMGRFVPDAPFKNNAYTDFVLKHMLRMAAEQGYDSIAWTTAKMQEDRWSDDFAKAYRIEYDQDIPRFLNKFGKQWGAKVGQTTLTGDYRRISVEKLNTDDIINAIEAYKADRSDGSDVNFAKIHNAANAFISEAYDSGIFEADLDGEAAGYLYDAIDWLIFEDDVRAGMERLLNEIASNGMQETVPSLEINDKMRESVLYEGQPQFQTRQSNKYDDLGNIIPLSKRSDKSNSDDIRYQRRIASATYFAGGGVVDFGLRGITLHNLAVEFDERIADVYKANNGDNIIVGDVSNFDITPYIGKVAHFHASPVCKNFSKAKNSYKFKFDAKTANKMLVDSGMFDADEANALTSQWGNNKEAPIDLITAKATANAIRKLAQSDVFKVFTLENVPGYKNSQAMKLITDALTESGFIFDDYTYNNANYGGFTARQRILLRAVRKEGGVLPALPKMQKANTGWFREIADLVDTFEETNVPNWMQERLDSMGIDVTKLDRALYVDGSGSADLGIPHAYAGELLPTITANTHLPKLFMPDGRVLEVSPRALARFTGLTDDYQLPKSKGRAKQVLGNGIPVQLTQAIIQPLLEANFADETEIEEHINEEEASYQFLKRVEDPKLLHELETGKTIKVYRAMQVVDGKLYSPMSGKVDGKWRNPIELGVWEMAEGHPERAVKQYNPKTGKEMPGWYFKLDKGNGDSLYARYNPYIHTSRSPLNDQFKGANKRGNLVTVEVEIPESEVIGGFQFEKAKDATGEVAWTSGVVSSRLARLGDPRLVILSRYDKPIRIVPDAEVAQLIADKISKHENLAIPEKTVTPSLAAELKKLGIPVLDAKAWKKYDEAHPTESFGKLPKKKKKPTKSDAQFQTRIKSPETIADDAKVVLSNLPSTVVGLNINDSTQPFTEQILNGEKTIETRFDYLPWMKNQTIAITRSGIGGPMQVVGFAKVVDIKTYANNKEFRNDEKNHLVAEGSKFDIDNRPKYGYVLDDVQKVTPFAVSPFQKTGNIENPFVDEEGTKAQFQVRTPYLTDNDVISQATELISEEDLTQAQKDAIGIYNKRLEKLRNLESQLSQVRVDANGHYTKDVREKVDALNQKITEAESDLYKAKDSPSIKAVLRKARENEINTELQKMREKSNARVAKIYDSAERKRYKGYVEEDVKTLSNMLLKNSDKEHIPEPLKLAVGKLLTSIDFTSKRQIKGGRETQKDIDFAENLTRLNDILRRQAAYMSDPGNNQGLDMYLDMPNGFTDQMSEFIANIKDTIEGFDPAENRVNLMTAQQLKELDYFLTVLTHSIRTMNAFHANAHYAKVVDASRSSMAELKKLGADNVQMEDARNFFFWDNTTPYYAFKRMGAAAQSVFESMQEGWDKLAFNTKQVIDFTQQAYKPEQAKVWGEEVHSIPLENGKVVKMTAAQMMSLYCLSKREAARGHLMGGGMRVANIDIKGDLKRGSGQSIHQTEPFTMTKDDVDTIISMISPEQIKVADKLQKYMNTVGTDWGNEISMKRFGYRYFTEDNYFPIQSDKTNLPAVDPEREATDLFRLLNMTMTKPLTYKANNALVVSDIFEVFANHMSDMAKYNALALPVLDAMKWYNYKDSVKNDEGQIKTSTVQRAIETAYGRYANNYFISFIKDLNGVHEGGRGTGFASRMIGSYKAAAVGANIRTALLQPTSYVRASGMISPKILAKAATLKPAIAEMQKYSGIAVWKDLGFYDTNIGRNIRDQIMNKTSTKDDIVEKSMWLAEKGDQITWGALWNACKLEAQMQGVKAENLMDATAKKFREVIYATQVVDSTMTRSHMMRDKGGIASLVTAFMSEPTLSYNIVLDAYAQYNAAKREGNKDLRVVVKNTVLPALGVYAVSQIAAAIVESIADAFRDDDDYDTFLQKWWEAFSGEDSILEGNIFQDLNPLGKLPYAKEVFDFFGSSGRMDEQWWQSIKDAYSAYKSWADGTNDKPFYSVVYSALKALSQVSGLPFSNAMREVAVLWNNTIGTLTGNKLKTYNPKPESAIRDAFEKGNLTEEEAVAELLAKEVSKDENDAYWTIKKWSYEGDATWNKNIYLYEAIQTGEGIPEAIKELQDTGYATNKIRTLISTKIKEYLIGDDETEPSINLEQAKELFSKSGLFTDEEIDNKLTSFVTDSVKKALMGDNVTDPSIDIDEAVKRLADSGYYTDDEATSKAYQWFYKDLFDTDENGTVSQVDVAVGVAKMSHDEAARIWDAFGYAKTYDEFMSDVKNSSMVDLQLNGVEYGAKNWKEGLVNPDLQDSTKDNLVAVYGGYMYDTYIGLREAGMSADEAYSSFDEIDTDNNDSAKQEEVVLYLVQNYSEEDAEYYWDAICAEKGWTENGKPRTYKSAKKKFKKAIAKLKK